MAYKTHAPRGVTRKEINKKLEQLLSKEDWNKLIHVLRDLNESVDYPSKGECEECAAPVVQVEEVAKPKVVEAPKKKSWWPL